jgi:hypothetical protein
MGGIIQNYRAKASQIRVTSTTQFEGGWHQWRLDFIGAGRHFEIACALILR